MNVVPILPPKKYDSSGRVCRLNSFALDFYKHGSSEAIVKENGWVFTLGYQPLFKRMRPNSYRTFLDFFGLSHALLLQDTWRSSKNIQAEGEGDGWNRTKWRSTVFWKFCFGPWFLAWYLKNTFKQHLNSVALKKQPTFCDAATSFPALSWLHFAKKLVLASGKVACFLRLPNEHPVVVF